MNPLLPSSRQRGNTYIRVILLIVVPAIAAIGALYWYASTVRYVNTDNAYIKSDIVTVSASTSGRVVKVHVADNQEVKKGEVLFRLDGRQHEIALRQSDAQLNSILNEITSMQANYKQISAEITDAEERLKYLRRQYRRQQELKIQGMSTDSAVEDVQYQVTKAVQTLSGLSQKAARQLAELGGDLNLDPKIHPDYLEALAEKNRAELNIEYTHVVAPVDGTVSRMRLQRGEWVDEGEPVFSLLDRSHVWIEANLKETQLTNVRPGQAVEVEVDAYPDEIFDARVASISGATGSEFLILPPQNATGNWVKVVQRIPVRIEINEPENPDGPEPPLLSGMTVQVSIDTKVEHQTLGFITRAFGGD